LLTTTLILFSSLALHAAGGRILPGHLPAPVRLRQSSPVGRMDPTKRLNLAIGLPLRNQEALTNLLNDLYDPNSSRYHQYLSPEQFTEAFGPSVEDYQAVIAFAESNGFTVTHLHSNRALLDVNASVGDIERAFHLSMQVYEHPTEARTFYAPDSEPSVEGLVPILDISGLDDFKLPKPLVHKLSDSPASQPQPQSGSGPGGTYRGGDFKAAYAPGVAATGLGQTVGLLEFDGYNASDISSYEAQTGLPSVTLSNVLLDSFNGTAGGNNIEVALDIEVAIAMAPGLSQVMVYEAGPSGNPNDILNRMVSDNVAKTLSSSWTWSGGPSGTTDNAFKQMAAQGQSFFQAAGDDGAYSAAAPAPEPADDPYITIVGGTTLTTSGAGGSWVSEKTWNWYNSGGGTNGTGGGISTSYLIPTWQQGLSMSSNQGSTTMRNFPDVALTADNIWITFNNGSSGAVGGTSCAAPLWAAYAALINQQAAANGRQPIGFINPAIYSLGQGTGYSAAFHDITTGNNTNNGSPNNFFAVSGFDLCTGWGTPAGSALLNALAGPTVAQISSNSLVLTAETCANNAVDPGETVTMNFGLINTGTANTASLVATLQAGGGVTSPSAPQTYGALAAGGAAVAKPFTFTASGSCGGTVTATLQLQDGSSNLGTVTFTIRLGAVSTLITFSENFDGVPAPALPSGWTTAVTSGIQSTWATTNGFDSSAPNSAFIPDTGSAAQTELVSPIIPISSTAAQLTFLQDYKLASHTHIGTTTYYDGGVLQISIAGGAFTDILSAGGSFTTGGYNCTLATTAGNPLGGSQAWGGTSGGWITTTVTIPATAAGQNVQLKWACGTGVNSSVGVGWFVDSVSLQDQVVNCCSANADVGLSQTAAPNPGTVGQNLIYTITITNAGPSAASNVAVTDSLPSSVTFVSASPGCINLGGSVACSIASLSGGAISNIVVTVKPAVEGSITNNVSVSSSTADPNMSNNNSLYATTVYVAPGISSQPTNQVTSVGGNAAFYITASGSSPLSYQWRFGGATLSGATSNSLVLANVQANQAGNYSVAVSNPSGSITSAVATLTVVVPPSISQQPTNQTAVMGGNSSFQVQAGGSAPLTYQWLFNGANLAAGTSSTLPLNNVQTNQAGNYSVIITNSAGAVTSAVAALTVLMPPAITLQPTNQTVVAGNSVSFQGGAAGSAPLNYQWLFGGKALSGATGPSLTLANVQASQAGSYSLVVTNTAGAATSVVAQLTVLLPPSITAQPTNQTVVVGSNANFQVTASGSSSLSYQWWFNGTNALGSSTNTLTVTNAQTSQAGGYSVIVTNSAGSITSAVAILTVGTPPGVTQQPSNQIVVQGQNATFTVSAGGDAPLSYQWRFNGTPLSASSTSSYTVSAATAANAGNYDAVVSNAYGAVTSAVAQLTVLIPTTITGQPTNQTVPAGGNVNFQVSVSGTSPLSYQWWFNGTNAVGSSTNTLTLNNAQASQAGTYNVVVTNAAGSVTSAVATLVIGIPPALNQQPSSLTVIQGQSASFTLAATGTAPLTYQWRFNGSPIVGGTATNYTVSGSTPASAGNYDAVVTNAYGSATSAVAQLTVLVPPTISSQPTNQTVAPGGTANFQVTAAGTSPLSYQWWFNGTNAVGGNTNLLNLSNAQSSQAGAYYVTVTNAAGAVTSTVATLTIGTPPAVSQQPSNVVIIQGQSASFSVVATGDAPLSYQWRFKGTPISAASASTYTIGSATVANAGNYDAVLTNAYGSVTTTVAQLTVLVPPSITSQPTNQTVSAGSSVNFQVAATGTAPLGYQWWFNDTNALGSSTNTLTVTNALASQAGGYSVVVTNSAGSATSAVAILTIGTPPSFTQQPSNQIVVQGQNATFSVAATGDAPLSYQWRFNGTPVNGAAANSYMVTAATSLNAGTYDVVLTNAYGSVTSSVAQLTVLVPPSISSQPTNLTVIAGGTVNFQVIASGSSPLSYQWWFNGTNAFGSNSNLLTIAKAQSSQAGSYSVVVTNSAGAVTSSLAQLTVLVPPSITTQPTNQTVAPGASANFYASASGTAPLSYQWTFNGSALPNATANSLLLTSAQAAQAGSYALVVTNAAGSATSSPANLVILVPPGISAPITSGNSVSVPVSSLTGLSYLLEYKNALSDSLWTPASSWQPGTGGILLLQDTNSFVGSRFYRVRCQ